MLDIENRGDLRDDGELVPVVEQLASCIAGGASVQAICRGDPALKSAPGWLVFQDEQRRGIAVNTEERIPSRTSLRLRLHAVQHALQIIEGFGGPEGFPLRFTDQEECPPTWRLYRVQVRGGPILCGVSLPAPILITKTPVKPRALPNARIAFVGYLNWDGLVSVGEARPLVSLMVECPAQYFKGTLCVSQEGIMTIQREIESQTGDGAGTGPAASAGALIRLDIGEIELSLQEIVALRSGTAIDLRAEMPLRCFMRVGSTTLAQGELRLDERGLVLVVKEVMS